MKRTAKWVSVAGGTVAAALAVEIRLMPVFEPVALPMS
jgi:hypothetical protein